MAARKKQNAVGDLLADGAQFHQLDTRVGAGHLRQLLPVDFVFEDVPRGAKQVWRTKAQFAVAKLRLGAGCDSFDGRESERRRVPTGGDRLAVTLSQQSDHLLNLDDLFGRGKDERGEALPVVLPEQSQAG